MEVLEMGLSGLKTVCACHRKLCLTIPRISGGVSKMGFIYLIFMFLLTGDLVWCYNLDLETRTVHSSETGSMFGYSVALHQDQGSKWLLVGAPRAQTSQPGVTRGGAVFRCPLESGGSCHEIPFDLKGNSIRHNGTHYRDVEDKSDQWFGASLYSSSNGIIVACAPRYVYFSTRLDKREPVGTCYVSRPTSTDYEEYSPCRSRVDGLPLVTDQFHQQGYCQLGLSAVLTSNQQGRQLMIGAVGSWYWQGQIFNFDFEDGPGRYEETKEGRARDDYSYMGYSSAVGHFDGDTQEDYAVGVPRGRQLQGKVVIYRQNLTIVDTIRGEQFGSYFGYSVAVTDLDGNGLDDVIVGAPFFADYSTDNSYETGRVYLFYQDNKHQFNKKNKDVLDGHHSQSRFGLAVAAIGDIDYDNYNDIAIGAPYGGENGRGVVYIYHGSMMGIITDVQQAIKADDVLSGISTFGWSLDGGMDMDNNQYPDLLVGASDSNTAVFLKSRPVVRVTPTIRVDPQQIQLDQENAICVVGEEQTRVQCMTVYACLLYTGIGVPDTLQFELNIKFDSQTNDSRMYFLQNEAIREENKIITARKNDQECFTFFGYLVKAFRDKLSPIVVDYSFDLVPESLSRNKRDVTPILNQRIPTTVKAEANIMKKCGPDDICIPDLAITATQIIDTYTLGESKKIGILVFVKNRGEDAYEAMLNITFPPSVYFHMIKDKKFDIPIFCEADTNSSSVTCDLGNPLPAGSTTNFTLVAAPDVINGSEPALIFRMEVNSSNPELPKDTGNNVVEIAIPIQQSANLRIGGTPDPEQFIYSDSDVRLYRESGSVGPIIKHKYILENLGPSAVENSVINIDWPGQDESGLNLLFLEEKPQVSRSDITCILLNETVKYSNNDGPVITKQNRGIQGDNQLKRHTREVTGVLIDGGVDKRDVAKRSSDDFQKIGCQEGKHGCLHIQCTVGEIKPGQSINISITARIWTSTLIHKKVAAPFYFVSKATAEVLRMPFKNMKVSPSTYTKSVNEVLTYVSPERLLPKRKGIEAWIIGVSVAAGLLLLLLLIILLWWCGFFRRRRPEEQAFFTPAPASPQNGEYKQVNQQAPDAKYRYT